MARQIARRPFRQTAKRKTVWIGTATTANLAIASGDNVIHSSFAPDALSMLAPTVVRVRGTFIVNPTAFGADLNYFGAYGLAVVSDEAFVAGAGSIPRVHDDDDWPGWIVHRYYSGHFEFHSGVGVNVQTFEQVIDFKAMRKVGVNETLVWMVEAQVGAVTVMLQARTLMMLS